MPVEALINREEHSNDQRFFDIISQLVNGLATTKGMKHYAVVTIDNWFDDRWVGFPGVFREYREFLGVQLPVLRSKGKLLPPFARSRVLDLAMHGRPTENLAAIFYVSSNSETNGRASLLVHFPSDKGSWDWYVGFKRNGNWKPIRHKNIGHQEFTGYVEMGI